MHILSSIKSHVASVAAAAAGASEPSSSNSTLSVSSGKTASTSSSQRDYGLQRSIRGALAGINPRPKYKRQPCPPISIQTKDISWPIGSGDRTSMQLDDYDILSPSDLRSPTAQCSSFDSYPGLVAIGETAAGTRLYSRQTSRSANSDSRATAFPLTRQRSNTTAKNASAAIVRARRAASIESVDATAVYGSSPSSPSFSITSVLPAAQIHRMRSEEPSPDTPSSPTFSFVDLQSPILPASPTRVLPANAVRVRREGTLTGVRSTPSGQNADRPYYQPANSFEMSQSTISTVVSTSPPGTMSVANRPTSMESEISANSRGSVGSKRASKKDTIDDNEVRGPPPRDDWDVVIDRIREYRATHEAPVDTVGCEALTEEEKDPKLKRFRSLISLMLSAQTKDEITAEAVRTLSQRLPGGLTPKALSEAPLDLIHECIRRVGFWQRKANYIKEAARTCLEQYDSDIPRTVPQLLSLPGVGPKMAYLAMHAAWQDTQGIGVDTHVLRITHRLGWVSESAKTPEATRNSLESWMPKSLWREINPLLVGFGQTVCRGVGPKCSECPVNNYCPSVQIKAKRNSRVKDMDELSQDTIFGDQAQLGDVDVEDLASMVRGAEQAIRSRKTGAGRSRQQGGEGEVGSVAKAEFPEIPDSPSSKSKRPDEFVRRTRARSRAGSCLNPDIKSDDEGKKKITTSTASPYFMRSRSNAASEEVRPEAKTDSVRSARAKVTAKKLYSRRLSKSDMQWALGEDWDPEDDSSSLSSLSDLEPGSEAENRTTNVSNKTEV